MSFLIYLSLTIIISLLILLSGWILGGKSNNTINKNIPFESGMNPIDNNNIKVNIQFYKIAIFFILFDIETIYLYTWVLSIKENGILGLIEMMIFILILLIGLIYIIKENGLLINNKNKKIPRDY
ncbi:NADH ubiquinone oxidoreductase chain A [Candidatus Purcelliella pentastirinorum]|uniref:NADH-quinone oxidoreductase subunit n=1 Tax=Candidatus Purcelliella pentastirinorum TaxID=472834 RepID=A0A346E079_9ENTR|nr:NADH-quinone oxidoreductase subunit A [Candidatus Purcelliella pentastirinorum]AXN02384.1 NADH ubiquinone oxidoreductase chain A [Candidatus Purcelliella pentastirinorum]